MTTRHTEILKALNHLKPNTEFTNEHATILDSTRSDRGFVRVIITDDIRVIVFTPNSVILHEARFNLEFPVSPLQAFVLSAQMLVLPSTSILLK